MWFAVLLAASGALGTWVFRPLGLPRGVEGNALRLLGGLCLSAAVAMAVGSVSLAWARGVLAAVAVAGAAHWLIARGKRAAAAPRPRSGAEPLGWLGWAALMTCAGALGLAAVSALAPVTSWDACVAHASLPQDYQHAGRLFVYEGNPYSAYPQLMHSLYAFTFASGETAAALVSLTFALAGCLAAFGIGDRLAGRRCGLVAAALFASAPVFIDQAGTFSLDLAFSAVVLAALAALLAWDDQPRYGWLLAAGFLAGSSCGIRHTGYVVCPILAAGVLVFSQGTGRWRSALVFAATAGLVASPWLLRSAIAVGNPVYPFFASVFGGGLGELDITSVGTHESLRSTSLTELVAFPWRCIMEPWRYDGWSKSPGGLVLILGVPGLFVGGRRARLLGLFCAAGIVALFFFRQYGRYYLPFFVAMMPVAAVAAFQIERLRHPIAALLILSFAYSLALDAAAVHFKFPVAFGAQSRADYLERRVERYPAFVYVRDELPGDDGLVLMLDRRTYYIGRPAYQNHEALHGIKSLPLAEQVAWLRDRGIRYVFCPRAYIEESPGYGETGLLDMFNGWRAAPRYFRLIRRLDLDRPRGDGTETVEIYEILPENGPGEAEPHVHP